MSFWVEQRKNHVVNQTIMTSLESVHRIATDGSYPEDLISVARRAYDVLMICKIRIERAEVALLIVSALDNVKTNIGHMQSNIDAYLTSRDAENLRAANIYIDQMLIAAGEIFEPSAAEIEGLSAVSAEYRKTVVKAIAQVRRALNQTQNFDQKNSDLLASLERSFENERLRLENRTSEEISNVRTKFQAVDDRLADVENKLTSEQQKWLNLVAEQQTNFSASQDLRSTEFAKTHAEFLTQTAAKLAEYQTQFASDQDLRRSTFSQAQDKLVERAHELTADLSAKLKSQHDRLAEAERDLGEARKEKLLALDVEYRGTADTILDEVRQHQTAVENLVGVIGNLGVTSGYQQVADHARKMLHIWQAVTVASLFALVLLAAAIAFPQQLTPYFKAQGDISLPSTDATTSSPPITTTEAKIKLSTGEDNNSLYREFLSRLFLSVALGVMATYAAKQASHFMRIEQRNRQRALELEALGPFIQPLEKGERDKFRIQIGDRSFAVDGIAVPPHHTNEADPATMLDILRSKDVIDSLGKLKEIFSTK